MEASAEQLKQLQERRWENVEILVIYIDGQRFGDHHILSAVGVDTEGKKHILGIESGATENAASVKRLLTRLRDHGLPTDRKYLFVIECQCRYKTPAILPILPIRAAVNLGGDAVGTLQ